MNHVPPPYSDNSATEKYNSHTRGTVQWRSNFRKPARDISRQDARRVHCCPSLLYNAHNGSISSKARSWPLAAKSCPLTIPIFIPLARNWLPTRACLQLDSGSSTTLLENRTSFICASKSAGQQCPVSRQALLTFLCRDCNGNRRGTKYTISELKQVLTNLLGEEDPLRYECVAPFAPSVLPDNM